MLGRFDGACSAADTCWSIWPIGMMKLSSNPMVRQHTGLGIRRFFLIEAAEDIQNLSLMVVLFF
jgi:hypothetical protein